MSFKNHYQTGVDEITHKNRITLTSTTNLAANQFIQEIDTQFEYVVAYIKAGFEHRPDLISELFYDTPTFDWLIMMINNISDPFEGLNVGDRILLPRL